MKILIHSNSPWAPTGYGTQTATIAPRVKRLGHEVIISAFYGVNGAVLTLDGIKILPASKDMYGNDMLLAHKQFFNADMVMPFLDLWVLNPDMLRSLGCAVPYFPIDHSPVPKITVNALASCQAGIVYSQFAVEELKKAGVKNIHYVPHGIDSGTYMIVDKKEARVKLGVPESAFMVLMVAANKGAPSRKSFNEQIHAFATLRESHPDALLYLHTDMRGVSGENLSALLENVGMPREAVMVCPQYQYLNGMFTEEHMSTLYSAADVLTNTAMGEGFGLAIVEAQMCGTPVIVGNWTSMPELCKTGWTVEHSCKLWTPQEAYQWVPSIESITDAMEKAYKKRGEHNPQDARALVMGYDADHVAEHYWKPVLETLAVQLTGHKENLAPVVIPARVVESPPPPPKVTVTMPVYNGKATIDRALESVLTGQNVALEAVIVDDDSNDGTWKHLRKYRGNPRIKIVRNQPGGGPVGALNAAIPYIRGEYVIKLDADDWFKSEALNVMAETLDTMPGVGFVYGQCQYHGQCDTLYIPEDFSEGEFLSRNGAIGEPMYRSSAHLEHGLKHRGHGEKDGRWYGLHDWDLLLQMIFTLGWKGFALRDTLIHHYVLHENGEHYKTWANRVEVLARFREMWPSLRVESI